MSTRIRRPAHGRTLSSHIDQFGEFIRRSAKRQHVRNMSADEVASWMFECLIIAHHTYESDKGDFGKYFWSVWLNKRHTLNRDANRAKRDGDETPVADFFDGIEFLEVMLTPVCKSHVNESGGKDTDLFILCPSDDPEQVTIWRLLATGHRPAEIIRDLGISNNRFYSIVNGWRSEETYAALVDALAERYAAATPIMRASSGKETQ